MKTPLQTRVRLATQTVVMCVCFQQRRVRHNANQALPAIAELLGATLSGAAVAMTRTAAANHTIAMTAACITTG